MKTDMVNHIWQNDHKIIDSQPTYFLTNSEGDSNGKLSHFQFANPPTAPINGGTCQSPKSNISQTSGGNINKYDGVVNGM